MGYMLNWAIMSWMILNRCACIFLACTSWLPGVTLRHVYRFDINYFRENPSGEDIQTEESFLYCSFLIQYSSKYDIKRPL